jgi:methionine-rich copper-binding protein CopC
LPINQRENTAIKYRDHAQRESSYDGPLSLDPNDQTSLILPITGSLAAGKYRVDWHAVAKDTHKTQGTYSFTVKP